MFKSKYLVLVVVAIVIIGGGWLLFGGKGSAGEFKIGVSVPLSGPVATLGQWALQGMELAKNQINAQGGVNGKSLQLVTEDDKCNPTDGTTAVTKLVNVDQAKAIIVYCGAVTGVAADVINGKALTYSISIRTEPLAGKYPFLFNLSPSAEKETGVLADYMHKKAGITTAAILYQSDFFGTTYKDAFTKAFISLGGRVTVVGSLENLAQPDFRVDLGKIKQAGTQAIFTSFNAPQYSVILKQAKELGLNVKFFSLWNTESKSLLNTAGNLASGIVYTYSFKEGATSAYEQFKNGYVAAYHTPAESNAANGYDSIQLIAAAVKTCGDDVACLVKQTSSISNYPGVSGTITFMNGEADKSIYLKTITGGQFVTLGQ